MVRTLITGLLIIAAGTAQAVPSNLYSGLSWRLVGPFRGGRVDAVAGVSGHPATWYFGAVDGGIFKTTDAGVTWKPLFQHEPVASIGALAVAPSNPKVIYAGTGESTIRSGASYGDGVYRSDDGGKTWTHVGLDQTRHIGRILVDPNNPDHVVVAAMGHAWGANAQRGVFVTTDGGKTWKKTLFVDEHTGAVDLARDPGNPSSVFATTWNAERTPWFQYPPQQGAGSAIWHSTDGGNTWHKLPMKGLPQHDVGRIGVAVAPGTHGRRLYAVVSADHSSGENSAGRGSGIYRSDDGGKNWHRVNKESRISGRGWYFGRIYVSPDNPDVVYVPNTSLYRSTDGGRHFTALKGSPNGDDMHCLWIDPRNPHRMIVGADQGASVSLDDGAHWSSWYNQPTAQIYHLSVDNAHPYRIYATQQDSGALRIPSRWYEGVINNRAWITIGAGESGYVFPRPGDPAITYGSGFGGSLSRYDVKSHQTTDISPVPIVPFGASPSQMKYYFPWNTALAVSPFSGKTLYVGAQRLLKSTDAGDRWQPVSPTLTAKSGKADCKGPPTRQDAAACGYSVIYAVAPSPAARGTVWAGTDAGRLWLTRDGGGHWHNVTPPGLGPWSRIDAVEPGAHSPATAYVAVDRHEVDDFAPYIYVTHDAGKHWRKAVDGIPDGDYVHIVRADPKRRGLLYAGTEQGAFVSFDDGKHWQSLQLNLPTVSVRDLRVHDGDLIAGTHGRGIWVLDDIEPLREADSKIASSAAHLFDPQPAKRLRLSQYKGEAVPPEIPHAANPPTGATIDYWLGKAPSGPVTLSIYAADGSLVRHYSSTTKPAQMPAGNFPDYWKSAPVTLPATAGFHRFVWDLRYTPPNTLNPEWGGPAVLHRTPRERQAPLVVPGHYRVVLTVADKHYTSSLTVKPDPSSDASRSEIEARVHAGLAIRDAINRSTRLIRRAREAESAAKQSGHTRRAGEIREALKTTDLVSVNGHLVGLLRTLDGADTPLPQPFVAAATRLEGKVQNASDEIAKLLVPGA